MNNGPLRGEQAPIRPHTILCAKIAATGTVLGISLLAVNAVTGLTYPFEIGGMRTFFAYWTTMAALLIFCALLAAQGLAALLLSYRRYLEISNALQVAGFFSILGVYFLTPGPSEMDWTSSPVIPALTWRLPSRDAGSAAFGCSYSPRRQWYSSRSPAKSMGLG